MYMIRLEQHRIYLFQRFKKGKNYTSMTNFTLFSEPSLLYYLADGLDNAP